MLNGKAMMIHLIVGLIKKTYKMGSYFSKPYRHLYYYFLLLYSINSHIFHNKHKH